MQTRAYNETYETQLLKNCKLLTGRAGNNYSFHLCDAYDA